ncbi:MAG: uracil-DNA glycosylase [Candidatus Cloacimonetes bacterium]|nr:uracil-DNA glycosylase [Candidatus Cloacimonadota bacterium]MBL7107812.1 uracil-DNA glycosylase [Candidatus Cloacimonadota bacterium]
MNKAKNFERQITIEQKLELLKLSGIDEVFGKNFIPENSKNLLKKLFEEFQNCQKCKLSKTRNNFVIGEGNSDAEIMFVGEGPGMQEDIQGKPFVGSAGKLLTKMLKAINLERESVYITNVVKCRPPQNRNPEADEISTCIPILYKQIEIIQPKIICALGKVAGNLLLKKDTTLGNMRGKFFQKENYKVFVTYHPSALLYHPQWKKPTWEDLQMLMNEYKKIS